MAHDQYWTWPVAGDVQTPVLYGAIGNLGIKGKDNYDTKAATGYPTGPDWLQPYVATALYVNYVRAALRANPDAPVLPWFAPQSWFGNDASSTTPVPWAKTPWWREAVLHSLLSAGQTNLLWWNSLATPDDEAQLDGALEHLDELLDGEAIAERLTPELLAYTGDYFVSAVRTNHGRVVGRASFRPGVKQAKFNLAGSAITLSPKDGQVGVSFSLELKTY
jgi:hypothetical protein